LTVGLANGSFSPLIKEAGMQEEYTGTLLEDGHIHIPQEIIDKLKIYKGSKVRVTVKVEREISKEKILSYAGLLSDLTGEEQKRFDESIKRRSLFEQRKAKI
jgi:CxxC motif-containing protein